LDEIKVMPKEIAACLLADMRGGREIGSFLTACRLYLKQRRREQIESVRAFYQRLPEGRARLTPCESKLTWLNADEDVWRSTENGEYSILANDGQCGSITTVVDGKYIRDPETGLLNGSEPDDKGAEETKSASGYTRSDYEKAVIGVTTGDGVVINTCIKHAFDKLIERNIWPQTARVALATKSVPAKKGRVVYVKNGTHIYVDNKTGTVITAIYKRKGK